MMGHRRHVILVSLALLLLAATTHAAGGHATHQAAAAAADGAITQLQGTGTADGVVVGSRSMTRRRSMAGSSPPSCEGKCGWWCVGSSCEAVLVPIEPSDPPEQDKKPFSRRHGSRSGGGDGSRRASASFQRLPPDYKPVTWTCKCVWA